MFGVQVYVLAPLAVSVALFPAQTTALLGVDVMVNEFIGAGFIVTTVGVAGQAPTPETVKVTAAVPCVTLICVLLASKEVKVPTLGTQV